MRKLIDSVALRDLDPFINLGVELEVAANPEVISIHTEFLRELCAQLGVSILDVVHVLHSYFQHTYHCPTVLGHLSVSSDDSGKVVK